MQLSPRRKAFRVLGVTFAILGGITLLYAVFVALPYSYYYDPGPNVEGVDIYVQSPQIIIGFTGIVLILLGYWTYRFIPSSERET